MLYLCSFRTFLTVSIHKSSKPPLCCCWAVCKFILSFEFATCQIHFDYKFWTWLLAKLLWLTSDWTKKHPAIICPYICAGLYMIGCKTGKNILKLPSFCNFELGTLRVGQMNTKTQTNPSQLLLTLSVTLLWIFLL